MPSHSSARYATGLAALLLAIGACSLNPKQDPSQFYVLTAMAVDTSGAPAAAARVAWEESIGVGPLRLPAYIDRPQMVTRLSEVQVSISEFERWAEPLKSNLTAVLARNLEIELGTTRVATFPWSTAVELTIDITVHRFERDASGNASLRCAWTILDRERAPLLSRESSYREPATDASTDAAVLALSRTVERLSADIAAALRQLPEN